MKTALTFALCFLLTVSALAQGKRFTEENKTRQLLEMQEGVLLVPLFRVSENGGIMTTTQSSEQTLKSEHNSQIIRAFETNYPFGEVYYFFGDNWWKILRGEREGLILNADREPVSSGSWKDKTFFLARFEPSGWHLPADIQYVKKSIDEFDNGQAAFRENLPKAVAEETALAIPLFRNFSATQNVHHNLLNQRLSERNKTIVSELNACQKDYPVFFFYENQWAKIKEENEDAPLFDCNFSEKQSDVDLEQISLFQPAFCPAPKDDENSSEFDKEMAIMNPNSNYYPALIIERLYDKAIAKNSRRGFLINFRYAYRLNYSSGVKGSYDSAVEGVVSKITTDLDELGLIPPTSEEQ
ncbi:hypothetical protein [Halocola ammonii]